MQKLSRALVGGSTQDCSDYRRAQLALWDCDLLVCKWYAHAWRRICLVSREVETSSFYAAQRGRVCPCVRITPSVSGLVSVFGHAPCTLGITWRASCSQLRWILLFCCWTRGLCWLVMEATRPRPKAKAKRKAKAKSGTIWQRENMVKQCVKLQTKSIRVVCRHEKCVPREMYTVA